MLLGINLVSIYSVATVIVHGIGILTAAHGVMVVRSSRGAIAWGISLITFPWVAIPLYWILGNNEFFEYAQALQNAYREKHNLVSQAYGAILEHKAILPERLSTIGKLTEVFTPLPFTTGNELELLIDGEQTYAAMLKAIAQAENYILLQSYIINSDRTGDEFQQALIAKANQGVRVNLLYDKIGSRKLSRRYLQTLRRHGIQVNGFGSTRRKGNRFRINFRNHRKILIVDGKIAFMGGLNIGDEYLGKNSRFGLWRDTHLQLRGAAVQCLQSVFLGDWYWVTREIPQVCWQVDEVTESNQTALILPTGPADRLRNCNLFFLSLIERSQNRIWIASPYFVPNTSILNALKLASLRGVEVRIILPNRPDHLTAYLCSFSYYTELESVGIQLYRYRSGFMHQKVILIDRDIAGIGTVNLDNRSFFLNFEVMTFSSDRHFISSIATMLREDLNSSRLVNLNVYQQKPFWFKLAARVSRLLAPIL
ncbi:cardiolipin synthase [Pleurocapsales cyanobacterium LEGE 10410]|nr:cardiolipin synthase [Pleurocapsales cyanobacterium LEGE 10410]